MAKFILVLVSICILIGAALTKSFRNNDYTNNKDSAEQSKVVLELFTSEGCSSCPPADELAAKLQKQFGDQLYVLEFHVDYWDRLGWKDPYSLALATQRQRIYGERLKLESIYTPQAIINGSDEAVGSDANKINSLIRKEITSKSIASLSLRAESSSANEILCRYEYHGPAAKINIALCQSESEIQVKAGENNGKKLHHTNIVRDFRQADPSHNQGKSEIRLEIPSGLNTANMSVIAYAQETEGKIVAASEVKPGVK